MLAWLSFVAAGAGGGIGLLKQQTPLYRADCLIEFGRDPSSSGAEGEFAAGAWDLTQQYLLGSRGIAERAVRELRLDLEADYVPPSMRGKPEATAEAVRTVQERLSVVPLEGTRLARVSVEDPNPERAARITNTLVNTYLQKAAEDRAASSQPIVGWVEEQIASSHRRLEQTEGELRAYIESHRDHALPLEEQERLVADEIKRTTEALVGARLRRVEAEARLNKLRAAAEFEDPFSIRSAELDERDEVKQLRARYVALVLEHNEVEEAQGADSRAAEQRLAKLNAARDEMRRITDAVVFSAQSELTEAQQVETQLAAALKRAQAIGHDLQLQLLQFGRLTRARDEAEVMLKTLGEQTSAKALAAAAARSARVVEPAVKPVRPRAQPVLERGLLGGFVGALLGALVLALLARRSTAPKNSAANASESGASDSGDVAEVLGAERQAPET